MILGDPPLAIAPQGQSQSRVTIDEVFRLIASRRPDTLALGDAANRETFTDGRPLRLSHAQADRMVSAIAGRLRAMGLPTDAIVGIHLPNTVENVVTFLGVLRAGMIAAPMPLLWRQADAVAALARIGAKALITCGHVGGFRHSHLAMRVAAEVFSIRYVCAFGKDLPDGVVPLDDLFSVENCDPIPPLERDLQGTAAAHVAAVTFDVGTGGVVPVARNHLELLAGGLGVLLESGLTQNAIVLSTLSPSSFAGLCLTLLPWLLVGGTLLLHHAFDPDVLASQRRDETCETLILPGPVAFSLAESGAFAGERPRCVIAAWRSPEQLATSPAWRARETILVDVPIFGEAGLLAARRDAEGRPAPIQFGPVAVPRGSPGAVAVAELLPTEANTVALRGPMVPHHSFPPGIERTGLPYFKVEPGGVVDTGYSCRIDSVTSAVVVTDSPAGIVSVGGYRLALNDLQDVVRHIDGAATLAALPDPVVGQRLIGNAADHDAMQAALNAAGVNPIVAAAFRDRSERAARA